MKNKFIQYFPPSENEIQEMWKNCTFVFDANVLLDMYRYSEKTRNEFMDLLEKIKESIWLPNQVALEFLRNRPEVIFAQQNMSLKTINLLEDNIKTIEGEIERKLNFRYHPAIDKKDLSEKIKKYFESLIKGFKTKRETHRDLMKNDDIIERLTNIFENSVGDEYDQKRLEDVFKEGAQRYKNQIPPGYSDSVGNNKKEGNAIYGDLIIWYQIIDYTKTNKKDIIFVSNDNKKDWWWISNNKTLGCRPELKEELLKKSRMKFHMYNSDRFLFLAKANRLFEIDDKSINEVKEIRKNQNEAEKSSKQILVDRAQKIQKSLESITLNISKLKNENIKFNQLYESGSINVLDLYDKLNQEDALYFKRKINDAIEEMIRKENGDSKEINLEEKNDADRKED